MDTRPWKKREIASRFRALRRKALFTQRRLGEIIGICRQSVNEIERRHVKPHEGTWDEFCELEAKYNRPSVILPTNWE